MRSIIIPLLLLATPAMADSRKPPSTLVVTSSTFGSDQAIPSEFTCEGANVSPPLSWTTVPSDTKSIAILVEDPDAPKHTFVHWMVVSLPPTTQSLDRGAVLPEGASSAKNDKGTAGYTGPCPPTGVHHYRFHVYALDTKLEKTPASRADFAREITGHILAAGHLTGTYRMK